ncbi:MAG TPA: hypothetical protein VL987_12820 [Cellvibrio sp.]|nr:hypothetical protein [Cellvibrio sp.]
MIHHVRSSLVRSLPLWLGCLLVTACGGGGGGSEGGGQSPDPVTVDLPVAFIDRPLPTDEDDPETLLPLDILDPAAFNPGAAIYVKPRATALAAAENITQDAFIADDNFDPEAPNYDVKDLSIHPDGDRLLFAMRAPEIPNADDDEQPKWDIWEYHLIDKVLRRVITSNIVAEAGHDVSPRYLPDDRIIFSSTRQTRSRGMLLDDNKPQYTAQEEGNDGPAFVLHVMDNDGTNIQQITYNQSHDLQPTVLGNGRVLFLRWDQANGRNNLSLYTVNPDGTDLQYHYGFNSLNTTPRDESLTLFRPQSLSDRRIAAIFKRRSEFLGGDMLVIDTENFVENDVPINGGGGEAQERIYHLDIVTDDERSRNGVFSSLHPLFDGTNRLLVSWSQCRMQVIATGRLVPCTDEWWENDAAEIAPPLFGIWIYNMTDDTQQPVVLGKEGRMFTEAVILEPQAPPSYIAPTTTNADLGTLHIRSVYDGNLADVDADNLNLSVLANPAQTSADNRPARFLRIVKAVSIADNDVLDEQEDTVYGNRFNQNTGLREIIGYTPVEPDGSVLVQIPADIAFTVEVLDGEGRRISNNATYWMQVRPGERLECNGCLNTSPTQPVSRADIVPDSINPGASGVAFPGTQRFDQFGTPELPQAGETMAEFAARTYFAAPGAQPGDPDIYLNAGLREPTVDLIFIDEWTDPALAPGRPRDEAFAYRYLGLIPGDSEQSSMKAPLKNKGCMDDWNSTCRIVINYENHIQYLWEIERTAASVVDELGELRPFNCIGCHAGSTTIADVTNPNLTGAIQLNLTRTPRQNTEMTSYFELLNARAEREVDEAGNVVTVPEFLLDAEGLPVLDEEGNPVPNPEYDETPPSIARGNARGSERFFSRFRENGSHSGFLNNSELKLLREWIDLGARYYQNPFDSADPIQE